MTETVELQEHDLLAAFMTACPVPTPADTAKWQRLHPAYADQIGEWARTLVQLTLPPVYESDAQCELVEKASARGIAGLNAIHRQCTSSRSLRDLSAAANTEVRHVAREIGVSRSILAYLEAGEFLPPVGRRLVEALSKTLKVSVEEIEDAIVNSFRSPDLGLAKATETPSILRRSYRELVQSSEMTEAEKVYWLTDC